VTALEKVFDEYDLDRIKRGLEDAVQVLRAAAPQQRGKDILKISSQLALFEALSSQAFLADPSLVENYLDEPFQLVQTNKRLRLARYVPAATVFLFDISPQKCLWAMQAWSKLPSPITKADFDFAVRDPLLKNLKTASEPITDLSFNQRLWYGIRQIIEKLDNELVTHSLRAMEVDLFRIMLEHLQYRTPALRFLLQTMQRLLEIAPKDYWDSMGAISPTTVIEQVFNNPQYDQFIQEARPDEEFGSSALKDLLSWIKPFLASLQIGHQAQACRSLTFQLMDRLQADRFPAYARTKCYQTGLEVLIWALESCNKEDMISKPVGRIIAGECLKVMDTYIGRILEMSSFSKNDDPASLVEPRLAIVKAALALECKSLKMDQETIMQKKCVPATPGPFSTTLWDAVVNNMKNRNILLAGAVLAGITDLAGLESFRTDQSDASTEVKKAFNKEWDRVTHRSCEALQRINDFNPDDLDELFQQSDTSAAIFAALFSPDPSTHNAAVNLIKSVSSESGRREAIRHLLLPFFATTLTSLSRSIRWITRNRSFARCPIMLKTCGDTLDVLGDYGSGLLRTRPLSSILEVDALEKFWEEQWQALKAIYETTEEWGKMKVQDSRGMRDFCRDTMDFSDRLFDQYSLYASAINAAVSDKMVKEGKPLDRKAGKELLRLPARGMEAMVQWLKLRDVQLAGTAVKLTKKVLDRLTEWGMKVDDAPRELLERIIQNGPQGRTHLTPQEKAELARALEANLGHSISPVDTDQERPIRDSSKSSTKAKKTKLGTIDLTDWRSKAKLPVNVVDVSDDGDFGDSDILDQDILSASRSVELLKEQKSSRASSHDGFHGASLRAKISRPDKRAINSAKHDIQVRADQISFRAKREKERAAKKKRDAEELAIVKKRIANKSGPGSVIEEGSVLGQIGIKGKDHAPKVASMMVSSESESDTDDQLDSDLFGGGSKTAKVSDAVRDYQSSRMKQAREPQPIKKTKQVRSAKDMRARLAPDLVSLHNTILGWDFFHSGDFPPGSERQDYSLVTNVFRHPKVYQSTFEPLLILEAWQGFLKSREEGNFKPFPISVSNRCTVDSFIEVSTVMQAADAKNTPISEADVVLMSKAPSPTTDDKQPHCFARVFKVVRKKTFIEIAYRINVGNSLVSSIVPNATLFGAKIQSLTPLEREYGALLGLQYFDLCDEIIKAKPSPLLSYSEKQIAPLVANFRINVAQAKAVKSAMDNDGFTLIQGYGLERDFAWKTNADIL
jgi:senataxin